jgi:peptidylprolyl isomerase
MAQAKPGDTVKVHYNGKFDDGNVFDSSEGRNPLSFTIGAGKIIPGFDKAVEGMAIGDKKTVVIPAEDAYGKHHENLVMTVTRSEFPEEANPAVGQQYQTENQDGRPLNLMVTAVEGDQITLDANHPLAGKNLTFDIELVEIAKNS